VLQRPVPAVPLTARCPCGSGRKYKRCCWARERREFAEALEKIRKAPVMVAESLAEPVAERIDEAIDILTTTAVAFADEETIAREWDLVEPVLGTFAFEGALVDIPLPGGRTAVEAFLRTEDSRTLHPAAREYLEAWNRSAFSLYEVEEVRREEGVTLKDLLRRRRFTVYDRGFSRQLRRWDVLFARLVEMDGIRLASDASAPFDRRHLETILRTLPEYKADLGARNLSWQRFFRREWTLPFALWVRTSFQPARPPALANTDGDPLMQIDLEWEVLPDRETELRRRLNAAGELGPDGPGRWALIAPGTGAFAGGVHHAAIGLEDSTLHVSVDSERRERQVTAYLKELAGDCLGTASRTATALTPENIEANLAGRESPPASAPDIPPELEERLLHDVLQSHYTDWIDRPLPALGGHTPKEAAADPALKKSLVALLKKIEHHHATAPPPMGTYDPSWLWKKLGLRRP
jgi:hypothetical protein